MNPWDFMNRLFRICPITLRDLFANPGTSFPSLPASPEKQGKGEFHRVGSIPVLSLSGTHEQIGRQEGHLLREQIRAFTKHYLSSAIGRNRSNWKQFRRWATGCREFLPDRYMDELRGLSGGSGLEAELLLCASVFLDFYSTVLCSCIAVSPEKSSSERFTVGRNLDFPSMGAAHRLTLFKAVNPDGYYRHVHLTWPGLTGVLTGMNEHGLTLALAEVDGAEPFGLGLPYTMMHRLLLEECRTVDDVEKRIRTLPRPRSNNLLVADGRGGAAVFEYDRSAVARRDPEDGWVYATNHFVSGTLSNQPISFKYASAVRRYATITRTRNATDRISDGQLFELLEELALGRLNLASLLMYPCSRRMNVRMGAPPAAQRKTQPFDLRPYLDGGSELTSEAAVGISSRSQ